MSNLQKKITTTSTLCLLAATAFASGHTTAGLEGLWLLFVVMGFAVFAVIINMASLIMGCGKPTMRTRVVLYLAAITDVILLLYCCDVWATRIEEHRQYLHYGPDVDAEGFRNFSKKAGVALLVCCLALLGNIALLVRNYKLRK